MLTLIINVHSNLFFIFCNFKSIKNTFKVYKTKLYIQLRTNCGLRNLFLNQVRLFKSYEIKHIFLIMKEKKCKILLNTHMSSMFTFHITTYTGTLIELLFIILYFYSTLHRSKIVKTLARTIISENHIESRNQAIFLLTFS